MELRKLRLVGTASDWRKLGKTNRIILYTAIFAAALLACSLFLAFSFPNPIEERLSWRPLFLRKSGNGNSASFLSFLVPIDDPSGGSLVTEKESAGSLGDGSQSRKDESSPLDPGVVKTDEEGSRSTVAEKAKRSELDEFSRNVEGKLNESEQGSKSSVESKKKRKKKKKKKKKENYGSEEFKQNSEKEDESLVQRSSEIVMDEYATRNDVVVTGFGKDKSSPELKVDQGINNQTSDLKQGNKNEEVSNGSSQIPGEENKNEDFSNEITASQKAEKKEDDIPLTQSEENKKQELSNRASRIREEENRNEVLSNGTTVIKKEGNKNTNLSNGTLAIQPAKNNNNDLSNGTSAMDKKEKKVDVSSGISVIQKDDNKNSSLSSNGTSSEMSQKEPKKCDLFMGKWVPDDTRPLYAAGSCPHIDESFNCFRNRRPDNLYERWRWQPHDCDIPRLNATDMLERLRNKRLTFVGDSLNRNMWESLVCILRDSVSDKSRVYEISGKKQFRTEGFYAFRYEDYNCTVEYVRAPFLVQEWEVEEGNGKKKETLRLDVIESSLSKVKDADIVIFNTGHWWTHEKTSKGQDYYQEGDYVYPELNVLEAYRKALKSWSNWVDSNLDPKKTTTLFRGYSATHFSGGQWNSGGQCHTETEPIYNETYITKYPPKMEVLESVLHEMKTEIFYLNITRMTDYRKEAHPSIYRKEFLSQEERIKQERYQDCSHWCLPGVPDIWNELVYAALLMTNKGSWRK